MFLFIHSTAVYCQPTKRQAFFLGAGDTGVNKTNKMLAFMELAF